MTEEFVKELLEKGEKITSYEGLNDWDDGIYIYTIAYQGHVYYYEEHEINQWRNNRTEGYVKELI